MAEQFRKTYISVNEFVESWEKEVYELTNLDYFIYQLINHLAAEIESVYFNALSSSSLLQLHSEETGTLCFNMGDGLQQFLDKNCFGACALRCPIHLNESLDVKDFQKRKKILGDFPAGIAQCKIKSQCLYSDLLHFVVIDSLLEFYQFEKGFMIEDDDPDLLLLAQFISDSILDYFQSKGKKRLVNPDENAGSEFARLIKTDNGEWLSQVDFTEDEVDLSEGDEWKLNGSGSGQIIEAFKESYKPDDSSTLYLPLLDRFREFLTDFLEINQIDALTIEELQEFFTIIVVHEVVSRDASLLEEAARIFRQLTQFLDFNQSTDLNLPFEGFLAETFPEIKRAFHLLQNYTDKNPLLDYLISDTASNPNIVDGFYEIVSISGSVTEIEDIHLKTRFKPVHFDNLDLSLLKKGDILHMQILPEGLGFQVTHLEMLYPAAAKNYLY